MRLELGELKSYRRTTVLDMHGKQKSEHKLVFAFFITLVKQRWRRERDSNPRYCLNSTPDFESGAFDHSAISPMFWAVVPPETVPQIRCSVVNQPCSAGQMAGLRAALDVEPAEQAPQVHFHRVL